MIQDKLTKQEQIFVNEVALTGNKTKAVKKAFGIKDSNYAGVKGNDLIRKPKIIDAIEKALPENLLLKVHREGLEARNEDSQPDYAVRHKYLDTAYKLKGSYAPEKSLNINIEAPVSERIKKIAEIINES